MSDIVTTQQPAMPAHIAAAFGSAATNEDLSAGVSGGYPILSYRGKTWALVVGGERNVINNEDGDPRASLELIIVKSNPHISKVYYPDGYVEGSSDKPACYSNDGVAPGLDAEDRQAVKCALCPHNQWGSRITENGARGKACSDVRRLAVAAAGDIETPMLLRVPAASLKELATYAQTLQKRSTPYQAVVTKVSFDPEAAYPKMQFQAKRWLTAEEAAAVIAQVDSDIVGQITTLTAATLEQDAKADPVDELGPPPAHVAQVATATATTPAPKRGPGRPPKAAVSETQVAEAMGATANEPKAPASAAFGASETPAPVQATAPSQPEPTANVLVSNANAKLDEMLSSLDFEDE